MNLREKECLSIAPLPFHDCSLNCNSLRGSLPLDGCGVVDGCGLHPHAGCVKLKRFHICSWNLGLKRGSAKELLRQEGYQECERVKVSREKDTEHARSYSHFHSMRLSLPRLAGGTSRLPR